MRGRVFSKLTYANVMATLALFIALGGGAYAAFHLPKDSVKSKNIVNGQVKAADLGAPLKFKEVALPAFNGCASPGYYKASDYSVAYARDPGGMVHLEGDAVRCGSTTDLVFSLPAGYRPGGNADFATTPGGSGGDVVFVSQAGTVRTNASASGGVPFNGISFRCAPSGQDGCP